MSTSYGLLNSFSIIDGLCLTAAMFILWRSYRRDTKSDVGKRAFSAILVPFIAPKRPFALPYARHPP